MISNFFVQHGSATAQEHVRARAVVLFFSYKIARPVARGFLLGELN